MAHRVQPDAAAMLRISQGGMHVTVTRSNYSTVVVDMQQLVGAATVAVRPLIPLQPVFFISITDNRFVKFMHTGRRQRSLRLRHHCIHVTSYQNHNGCVSALGFSLQFDPHV